MDNQLRDEYAQVLFGAEEYEVGIPIVSFYEDDQREWKDISEDEREVYRRAVDTLLAHISPCLAKRRSGEPIFVLLGHDKSAPGLVEEWAMAAHTHGCRAEKVSDAFDIASKMRKYQAAHGGKYPD